MPTLVRWYVKTALCYLAAALTAGVLITFRTGSVLTPTYLHLFLVGWITQLIFGIAIWMLPTLSREHPRGRDWLNWAVYALLNAGLLLRVVAEPMLAYERTPLWSNTLVTAALFQWLAGVGFVINAWGRVRGPRRRQD